MSNPTTLQGLADSLVASIRMAEHRGEASGNTPAGQYHAGYREALLDTRATVLAMIAAANVAEDDDETDDWTREYDTERDHESYTDLAQELRKDA